MKRVPHYLKGNSKVERAHAAVWLDTETWQKPVSPIEVSHHLTFGWGVFQRTRGLDAWTEPEWLRFEKRREFWDWLYSKLRQRTRTYMFSHNLGFDATVMGMFDELPAAGWKLTGAVIEAPPVILKWRKGTQTLICLDTLNWWRTSLQKLGKSIGLEKLTMPAPDASREEWDAYGRRDVEVIHRAVHLWWRFLIDHDLGGFAPTLASQAMRAFRHRFLKQPILLDDHEGALQLARASLHGGRVEAFRIGNVKGPIFHYDVNSMYPTVMRDKLYPTVLRATARDVTEDELAKWLKKYAIVAEVELYTTRPRYAHVVDGRLCFPVGHLRTTLTTPDLVEALAAGELKRILHASLYEQAEIFQPFVNEIYALRLQAQASGDAVQAYLLKILLNSLYGKFAQRGQVWTNIETTPDPTVRQWVEVDAPTGVVRTLRQFSKVIQERSHEPESQDSHPAIAAHVTAYARQLLWQYMERAGRRNVLYCDTDSLFVTHAGNGALAEAIHPTNLGALKHEGTYEWVSFFGAKDYQTPDRRVVKGVRAKAEWTGDSSVVQEEWTRLAGLIRKGSLDSPRTLQRTKVLRRTYSKGRVLRDGSVLPLTLREW